MRASLTVEVGTATPPRVDLEVAVPVTLGRSRDNSIVLHDEHASRQHAQVYAEDGRWFLRDLGTLNGTFVNGEKIAAPVPLDDGQLIGIADMRLRFHLDAVDLELTPCAPPARDAAPSNQTVLWPDDFAALYEFTTASVEDKDPAALIERTLEIVARRTRASVCGFLNLDSDQPLSKKVYPQTAEVDLQLSRELTRRAQETGRMVWLQSGGYDFGSSDSLAAYMDALCVPLKAEGTPLGALHVYKGNGAFNAREVRFCEIVAGYAASSLAFMRLFRSLQAENSRLRQSAPQSEELVGSSTAMQNLRKLIARAAGSAATVLIHGETGVGKELVALALHRQSPRSQGPLVVANCGAIAESLCESELFGHLKGAFTGATAGHIGLFQQADDGTLLLDEIGDMPLDTQVKLLRAIEAKTFRPLGATKDLRTDVRVLAATHRDLEKEVKAGKFREDLFYRLRVIYIPVPPLREHREDIPELVSFFLKTLGQTHAHLKTIAPSALRRLMEYPWPGNVRQLRAALENAVIMGEGNTIEEADLSLPDVHAAHHPSVLTLEEAEMRAIKLALEKTGGHIVQTATLLGIHRETLSKKIKQHDLRPQSDD